MSHIAIFLLSLTGFASLHFAMSRHQQDWLKRKLTSPVSQSLKAAGFALLALAFVTAGSMFGWGYGTVAWFGWMTAAAALIVTANTNRDRIRAIMARRRS
jgi:hypothetical protein